MKKLKMALVGAGIIGHCHAQCLFESPYIDFCAVVDIRPEAAKSLADTYGIAWFDSVEKCLAEMPEIEAYDVCVQEDFHVAPTVTIANAGKHILIEKPIAKTTKESLEIIEAVEKNGVRLLVAHLLHYDARYAQLLESIERGDLGDISHIFVRRANTWSTAKRLGGKVSYMYYLGVHDIEIMCACAKGGRPTRVYAQTPTKVCEQFGDADGMFAIVNFDNGIVGSFEIDWSTPDPSPRPVWSVARVAGTKGTGEVDADFYGLTMHLDGNYAKGDTHLSPVYNGVMHGDMPQQINHFAKAILEDKPFIVNLQTPVDAVRIIDAAFESVKTGLPVDIKY